MRNERGVLTRHIQPQGERPLLAVGVNNVQFTCEGPDGYRARANVTVISHGEPLGGKHPQIGYGAIVPVRAWSIEQRLTVGLHPETFATPKVPR